MMRYRAAVGALALAIAVQANGADGQSVYSEHCSRCHAPVELTQRVRNDWNGRTAAALLADVRQTMPAEAPGRLSGGRMPAGVVAARELGGRGNR